MQLHVVVGSPNSRKVLAVVHHLGIAVDLNWMDFFAGELRSPAYLALNPNGMVPALVDGELKLWESNAIMRYLAEGTSGQTLWPDDRRRRADVARWMDWELAHFNKALGVLSFETVAKPGFMGQPPDAAAVSWARRELTRFAPVLDAALAGRRHLVGDALTLADYAVAHLESFVDAVPFDWAPYPQLRGFFDRMRDQEHWARTAPPSPQAVGRKPAP